MATTALASATLAKGYLGIHRVKTTHPNPGRGAGVYPVTWTAQASYVTGTSALTFQWGYSCDAYGDTNYNLPKVTTPWPATQQLIQQAQSALNANTVIIIGVTPQ
jgi:hypothetical protein